MEWWGGWQSVHGEETGTDTARSECEWVESKMREEKEKERKRMKEVQLEEQKKE